jgi:hypothetical protein
MNPIGKKVGKYIMITAISLLALTGVIILILSPLAKYLVEKYDTRILGREVKVDRIYINPFTGLVSISNLDIFELQKDTVFLSAKNVRANFSVYKLFFDEYEITELIIHEPVGYIIQKKAFLNFNDLIERFTPRPSLTNHARVHLSVLKLIVSDGKFNYREKIIPIDYAIHQVNIECTGIYWNRDTIAADYSFASAHQTGNVRGHFTINTRTLDYRLATVAHDFDLELIRQYLWELINYGMFRARLEANVTAAGNFNSINEITLKGRLAIDDFHLGKTVEDDYTSFKRLSLVIEELSPINKKYLFDSVTLDNPFFLFERFDSLDNFQAMFGKDASNISDVTNQPGRFNLVIQISRYIETLSKRFFASQYRINSLAINNGDLNFSDYSLSQQFSIRANQLSLKADSITKTNKRVKFLINATIASYGTTSATLSMNPLDSGDIDFDYRIDKVPIAIFNPYIISSTSYALDKGTIELSGAWKVREGNIQSNNHLVLIDPRIGTRLKSKELKWIPLPIITAFVRERGNIIDYKIPITGSLKDPKFHLRDVFIDLFENIFIKPPTLPYGLEIKTAERSIESSIAINWKMGQSTLERNQIRFINNMARFLKTNKEASIDVYPEYYAAKEQEQILFYEARKKYFLLTHQKNASEFSKKDSLAVGKIELKKVKWYLVKDLTKITRDTTMFTIQDRCNHFLNNNAVAQFYSNLVESRRNSLLSAFINKGVEKQVRIHANKSIIPHDGFSSLRIHYNGSMPEELQRSYDKLFDLNKRVLRQKYFKTALSADRKP